MAKNKLLALGLVGIGGLLLWQKMSSKDQSTEQNESSGYGAGSSSQYQGAPDGALTSENSGTTYNINLESPEMPQTTMSEPTFKKESSSPDLRSGRSDMADQGMTGETVKTDNFKGEVFKDKSGNVVGGYDYENQMSVKPEVITKKEEKSTPFADQFGQKQSTI